MSTPMSAGPESRTIELTLRPGRPEDALACGRICYEAFGAIADRHNFPRDFPSAEAAMRNAVTGAAMPRAGVEPAAYSLGGSRSILLSYRGREPTTIPVARVNANSTGRGHSASHSAALSCTRPRREWSMHGLFRRSIRVVRARVA